MSDHAAERALSRRGWTLVAVVLGWNVTRSIIDPLSQLEAGARALAKGDFGHRVAIRGEDELAELGRVLNDSAQQLAVLYETLRSNEARFRLTIDTIPAFVWSALPDGSVDYINRRWLEFSGLSLEQGLGFGREIAVHPEDRTHFLEAWTAGVASGKAMEFEARVRRADGQYRWLLIRNVPLHDEAANIVKWYGTSADIDDRKRMEERLHDLVRTDHLTTLPNRFLLDERFANGLAQAQREGSLLARTTPSSSSRSRPARSRRGRRRPRHRG